MMAIATKKNYDNPCYSLSISFFLNQVEASRNFLVSDSAPKRHAGGTGLQK
jgi:hypothetical protein